MSSGSKSTDSSHTEGGNKRSTNVKGSLVLGTFNNRVGFEWVKAEVNRSQQFL